MKKLFILILSTTILVSSPHVARCEKKVEKKITSTMDTDRPARFYLRGMFDVGLGIEKDLDSIYNVGAGAFFRIHDHYLLGLGIRYLHVNWGVLDSTSRGILFDFSLLREFRSSVKKWFNPSIYFTFKPGFVPEYDDSKFELLFREKSKKKTKYKNQFYGEGVVGLSLKFLSVLRFNLGIGYFNLLPFNRPGFLLQAGYELNLPLPAKNFHLE